MLVNRGYANTMHNVNLKQTIKLLRAVIVVLFGRWVAGHQSLVSVAHCYRSVSAANRQAMVGTEVAGHASRFVIHTNNSTLQCGLPGPPDRRKSNKVYDTAVSNVTTAVSRSSQSLQPIRQSGPVWSVSYIITAVWTFSTLAKPQNFLGRNRILPKVVDQYLAENETCQNNSYCCIRRRNQKRILVGLYLVSNWPKYITPHSAPPTLLTILASFLMNTFPFSIRSQLSLNPAIITFVNFVASVLTSTSK